jgi:hypothetical protein
MDVFCEEAGHDAGEFAGAVHVRVVPGAFEDRKPSERSAAGLADRGVVRSASRSTERAAAP